MCPRVRIERLSCGKRKGLLSSFYRMEVHISNLFSLYLIVPSLFNFLFSYKGGYDLFELI